MSGLFLDFYVLVFAKKNKLMRVTWQLASDEKIIIILCYDALMQKKKYINHV